MALSYIPESLKQAVRIRAMERCEYCQLHQQGQAGTFHIDHVIPIKADGPTHLDNLALACVSCSLYKGARYLLKDSQTGKIVNIFNPRQQLWDEHFMWEKYQIIGKTVVGTATVSALNMNRPLMIAIRKEEEFWGRYP